jgi:hypothetical protein
MYVRIASQEKLHSGAGSCNAREGASDQNNGVCISELRTGLAFGTGGVNSHIQATEARHGLIDQVFYVVLVAYVGIDVFHLRVDSVELSHQISARFVASTRDDDARTLFRESKGSGSSNARKGASDQDNCGIHGELLRGQFLLS